MYCQALGYEVVEVLSENVSTRKPMHKRKALSDALKRTRAGEADVIIAQFVDRLSRNTVEFLSEFVYGGAPVVAMDLGLNPTTAIGRFVATIMAAKAQLERDQTSERTSAALAELSARGVPLGANSHANPVLVDRAVVDRMRALRAEGLSTRNIARSLTEAGLLTPRGGRQWSHSTVATVLRRMDAA